VSEIGDLVRGHYARSDLEQAILTALEEAGIDSSAPVAEALFPIDQLHAGGAQATRYLLEQLQLGPMTQLLDIGCGIGGPARMAAALFSCPVVGVDLSEDFINAGRRLTERVGLDDLVKLTVAAGDDLSFPDESLERAMMIHVGMSIPDKPAVFAEVRRVLRQGAWFGLYEQMRIGDSTPRYPLPWAEDERASFLESPETYAEMLNAAGFIVERTEDRAAAMSPPPERQHLSPATIFGQRFVQRIENNMAAMRTRVLAPVVILARAD
jgi:MPBQ/MSBQ methyltransferase